MSEPRLLLAEASTKWRAKLLTALGEDAQRATTSASGAKLKAALGDPTWTVIVIGDGLAELSGFDALYQASREPRGDARRPIVLMLLDVLHDTELLSLLRSRGVHGVISREAPMDELVARIRSCLYVDSRVAKRELIKVKGTLVADAQRFAITVEDLSVGGALISGPARKLQPVTVVGRRFVLQTQLADTTLVVEVIIRSVHLRKGFLGNHLALGVSFVEPSAEQRQMVDAILKRAAEARATRDMVWSATTGGMGRSPF